MPIKIDTFDRKILQELERDASQPLHQLSTKIKRSKQFVSFRIKRMEDAKLITGYHAIIDVLSLGYLTFRIYLDLQTMTEAQKHAVAQELKKHPQVAAITFIHEKWDLGLFIVVKTLREFRDFWDETLHRYKAHIRNHIISIYAPVHNFEKVFLPKQTRTERALGYGQQADTAIDTNLLFTYARSVRQPILTLAKHVGKAPVTTNKHIQILEKQKTIIGYKLGLDLSVIGYQYYVVELLLDNVERVPQMLAFCKERPEVYQVNRILQGGADLEIVSMTENKEQLLALIDALKEKFSEIKDDDFFEFDIIYSRGILPV